MVERAGLVIANVGWQQFSVRVVLNLQKENSKRTEEKFGRGKLEKGADRLLLNCAILGNI